MTLVITAFAHLVDGLADLLQPLFHTSAVAAAIVLFTVCVRIALYPLARAGAKGQKARAELAPQVARLREKHAKNPDALRRALAELYATEKVSPLAGCLPMLLQAAAFYLLYRVFSSNRIDGTPNELLSHFLLGAPLGGRWTDTLAHGDVCGAAGLVHMALLALTAAVATVTYRASRRQQPPAGTGTATATATATATDPTAPGAAALAGVARFLPLMSFFTLVTVAVVPLATSLYVVTSTTWSAVERYALQRPAPTAREDAVRNGTRRGKSARAD